MNKNRALHGSIFSAIVWKLADFSTFRLFRTSHEGKWITLSSLQYVVVNGLVVSYVIHRCPPDVDPQIYYVHHVVSDIDPQLLDANVWPSLVRAYCPDYLENSSDKWLQCNYPNMHQQVELWFVIDLRWTGSINWTHAPLPSPLKCTILIVVAITFRRKFSQETLKSLTSLSRILIQPHRIRWHQLIIDRKFSKYF